ncbi:transglutaminase-like domain-containing protein [Ornithinimicrobium sp. F0845]|uniref:transglutaminase-like domain-containing protein n=1 Tax=Ornithinimicrobium sp. F0845 TaxID=2926412 RepID=UPI001FF1F347|nr:transglutaminase-like domain-containing protein [Ornithinimicrobium sp. F0845]MCK0113370.1 transglutaminase-like domain-containing protein [Ornithinimicrobium sp. F0845]
MALRLDRHTAYSDPGPWADLLTAVEPDPAVLSAVARNVIVHYRDDAVATPPHTRDDIHARWLVRSLERDQQRHGSAALDVARAPEERVQGCCRDHTLFACAVLRQHGIAARGRLGFAGYLNPGFHHDHVVVEARLDGPDGRWVRFDPELSGPQGGLDTPMDMPTGPDSPFPTAAEVWRSWRAGQIDPQQYGVAPGHPEGGPTMIQQYVLRDLAHRFGEELLLWDAWGAMAPPGRDVPEDLVTLTDRVAAQVVAADAGNSVAEEALRCWFLSDPRLHPGDRVHRFDPDGGPPVEESLARADHS